MTLEHPFVLGTAGHIDHGKTRLVQALTGVDCDRLTDEKKRGITIELGFAPLELPSGRVVSIIDVPGHERFIRQMTAGAAGIDAVMMVVAADEGVMPQTREHLDILKLLGVRNGIVVITKTDAVDSEMLELAAADIADFVSGSFLESAETIAVSAQTKEGLERLQWAIERIVDNTPARRRDGAFFMPIDRAFSMKGFGSVVTGTSYRGAIADGDDVEVLPSGLKSKVRSIQVHGLSSGEAVAGQRTAINLASVSLDDLARGDVVCAAGRYRSSDSLDVELMLLSASPESVKHWQRVRLHIGTADVIARINLLSKDKEANYELNPGERTEAQLLLEEPVAVTAGQRFVIRFYSPLVTIGGGMVLIPNSRRPKSRAKRERLAAILAGLCADYTDEAYLTALVEKEGILSRTELFDRSQMEREKFDSALSAIGAPADNSASDSPVRSFDGATQRIYLSGSLTASIAKLICEKTGEFHENHPELVGLPAEDLRSRLSASPGLHLDSKDFKGLLGLMIEDGVVVERASGGNPKYALPAFTPRVDDDFQRLLTELRGILDAAGFELIETASLPDLLGVTPPVANKLTGYLREKEGLAIVGEGMLLPGRLAEKARSVISEIEGEITLAAVRDRFNTSRKYALPILEYFDSTGVTRRQGDKRILLR